MTTFETLLEQESQDLSEAVSEAGVMDVSELRALYYGRLNIMVAFSNDHEYDVDGDASGRVYRPYGVIAYPVNDVVAKKVISPNWYAHVFRDKSSSSESIQDIQTYSTEQYSRDFETMKSLDYINQDALRDAEDRVRHNARLRTPFMRLWTTINLLLENVSNSDMIWSQIFMDMGYKVIKDQRGTGLFGRRNVPTYLFLEQSVMERFDIVPIQKHRDDRRRRVTDQVDRIVKRLRTRRNRVAKKQNLKDQRGSSGSLEKSTLGKLFS